MDTIDSAQSFVALCTLCRTYADTCSASPVSHALCRRHNSTSSFFILRLCRFTAFAPNTLQLSFDSAVDLPIITICPSPVTAIECIEEAENSAKCGDHSGRHNANRFSTAAKYRSLESIQTNLLNLLSEKATSPHTHAICKVCTSTVSPFSIIILVDYVIYLFDRCSFYKTE